MKKSISVLLAAALLVTGVAGGAAHGRESARAAKSYGEYLSARGSESGLMLDPTVAIEPERFEDIAPSASAGAASIVLTPDAQMNVTLGGTVKSLAAVFDEYLRGKFIPVVRLGGDTADPFLKWLKESYAISDIMAISDDISVIGKLYADQSAGYLVNTIYDLTAHKLGAGRLDEWKNIAAANRAGCNILLYDASDPNLPVAAEYVEAMTKSCWAKADDKEEAVAAMAAGCFGVLSFSAQAVGEALSCFEKEGFARAQFIAAHRGITGYCNEQSLTAIAATENEGATHIEVDLQITGDEQLFICHNSATSITSDGDVGFPNAKASDIRKFTLSDYSKKYGETFPTLEETIELLIDSDVIFIFEMKLDEGTEVAADQLKAIENLKKVLDKYPAMEGRWYAITFYSIWAERLREVFPEVPVGFLGAGNSYYTQTKPDYPKFWDGVYVTRENMKDCMRHVTRKYNVGLDERAHREDQTIDPLTSTLWPTWLARGYAENSWTFYDRSHFATRCNVATTDVAEQSAMLAKEIVVPETLSSAALKEGKITLPCKNYNGWIEERECEIVLVSQNGDRAKVLFYLTQNTGAPENIEFGLYSRLAEVTVKE